MQDKTKVTSSTCPSDAPAHKAVRKGTFAWALAQADASQTPAAALGLPAPLRRLARLCRTLAEAAGSEPFVLGTSRAAEVVGAGSNYVLGGLAMATLTRAGL